jgi:hypothetical protein
MLQKFLLSASLAGLLLAAGARAQPRYQDSLSDQQAPKVHSVKGKVTQVETGGKAFSMDISQGNDKRPMRFVVDKGTTVQGHVAAGTTASVDYQSDGNGQLVALAVTEQSAQSQ